MIGRAREGQLRWDEYWAAKREERRKNREERKKEIPLLATACHEILSNASAPLTMREIQRQLPEGVNASLPQIQGVLQYRLPVKSFKKLFNVRGGFECRTLYELESSTASQSVNYNCLIDATRSDSS